MYDGHDVSWWLGKTIIKNTGDVPIEDFRISYKIDKYCDWTSAETYAEIVPGQTIRDYCWPCFEPDDMAKIGTKLGAELTMRYEYAGLDGPREKQAKFSFLSKNDFVWSFLAEEDVLIFEDAYENARLLPSFVTTNDPTIQEAAKVLTGGLGTMYDDEALEAVNRIWNGLQQYGLAYVSEPTTFWSGDFAQHIQFPSESLSHLGGNCVDLSLLFSSMLEAVGIKTYLLMSQGHCQFAFQLPESGDIYPVEETAIQNVDLPTAIDYAFQTVEEQQNEGTFFMVDVQEQWANGVVPAW
jgi:transglutaminase-like putative cysteine protease